MKKHFDPKITSPRVAFTRNRTTIVYEMRLDFGNFESQNVAPGIVQRPR